MAPDVAGKGGREEDEGNADRGRENQQRDESDAPGCPVTVRAFAVLAGYYAILLVLAFYGVHRFRLILRHYRIPARDPLPPVFPTAPLDILVQLPVYNERFVVERLLDACAALRVPAGGHLRLQLLDDSADETTTIADAAVARLAAEGVDVVHVRRTTRGGFKAGALAHGLALDGARPEGAAPYAAIFDADFVPAPDFLEKTLPHLADPLVALVQARWEHLNRDESLLTRLQALFLDGHFVLESAVRFRAGLFFNFNGTAGVFRRAAIEDGGGWAGDTVTEDLDLSYRILLKGWRFVFLSGVTAPAEVPVAMKDFKSQQARWTKGSIEVARKLLPEVLRAPLPRATRLEAFIHLTNNVSYPLLVLLALLVVPSLEVRHEIGWMKLLWLDAPLFLVSSLSVGLFYTVSQRVLKRPWLRNFRLVPMMMSLGIGMAVQNAVGVVEALCGRRTPFVRTPKRGSARPEFPYRTRLRPVAAAEGALLAYFAVALVWCAAARLWAAVPFVLVFFTGFLYNGVLSLLPARR